MLKNCFFFLAVSLIMVSCKQSESLYPKKRTLKEHVWAEKDEEGTYTIHFSKDGPWEIYHGYLPSEINWEEPFMTVEGTSVSFKQFKRFKRSFFGITGPKGNRHIVSERQIPLEGAPNFRDLGGIPTKDGRIVRWGLLYRSGHLNKLKEEDLNYFRELGIKSVVDFRYHNEIEEKPNLYPAGYPVDYTKITIGDRFGEEYQAFTRKTVRKLTPTQANDLMVDVYGHFADTLAVDFRPFVDMLFESNNIPMLYHCSAGKDRTGFATALILSALNVDRQVILDDFLMSNFYRNKKNRSVLGKAWLVRINKETLSPLLIVEKEYLEASFKAIDQKYGGMDNYLESQFGLTDSLRHALIDKYTFADPASLSTDAP